MAHCPGKLILILFTFLCYIATLVFTVLSFYGGIEIGLYLTDITGNSTDFYSLDTDPANWTFYIVWGAIYIWQLLWLIYSLTTICRSNKGKYLYTMDFMPSAMYAMLIFNLIFNVAWLFLVDRGYQVLAFVDIALLPFTLYVVLFFSFSRLYRNLDVMFKRHMYADIWLVRILVQNGLALYATWVTLATLISLGSIISYATDIDRPTVSTIIFSLIATEVVIWFVLDVVLFDKYTRYLFTPYIVEVIAAAGIVANNFSLDKRYLNSIFMLVLISFTALLLFVKIIIIFVRHNLHPIVSSKSSKYSDTVYLS